MNDLNSVLLEGVLVENPKASTSPDGQARCNFIVTTVWEDMRHEGRKTETFYFDVVVYGQLGQKCLDDLKAGRGVRVVGRLKRENSTDPEGEYHPEIKIVAEHVEFRPLKSERGE